MPRIAIVGLACLFPGAPGLARFWQNIVDGVDAIGEVPPARWDASFYDPDSTAVDRFYCKRGGFVDEHARFDPLAFGIMPKIAGVVEPDQLLTLRVGYEALQDAGYDERPFARERTGVIVGRGNYVSAGVLRLEQHVRLLPQVLQTLRDLFPDISEEALAATRERLQREFSYYGPDMAAGLIPNLIASRLANRLDLHGPAYTVDAACASSLLAVEQACASLARGETDMMLVGGAHLTHDLTFWATFCQLGALSRSGGIRPLSADADGILAGEGVGMAVLKRLDDALADGDRIYAVIEGTGSSSDGRSSSLVAPSAAGQRIALDKAWSDLPFGRESIGLVEAHGTGTPTGDGVELDTLAAFFGPAEAGVERPVIGSVKSMIGHTMPASGMAGLIKTALSIHHGVLPPTLHCERPHPRLADTRFRVIGARESWPQPREQRVAALNAFGFGGINAHVVLRGLPEAGPAIPCVPPAPTLPAVLMLAADNTAALLEKLDAVIAGDFAGALTGALAGGPGQGACRLVVVSPDDRRLGMARKAVASGKPWPGRQQIWFSPNGLLATGGKLAFVFPGVDSAFSPQATDLAAHFGKPLPPYCETLDPAQSLLKVVLGLLGFNRFLFDILTGLGIRPDAFAGHSVGEWSAMLCAGMMDQSLSDRTNAGLDFDAVNFPDVQFLAAACDEARLLAAMDGLDEIALSHDNCPHQVIACGRREAIATVAERLRGEAVFTQVLPIVSGFHSPLFAGHMDWYRDFFGSAELAEPALPVWSATSARPFPPEQDGKRQLALDHLLQPVRFRSLIEAMHDEGYRVFVQVGTGSLTGFIADTLSGRPHHAIQSNHEARSGLAQLQQLCAALWVEGADFDTALLMPRQPAPAPEAVRPPAAADARGLQLSLGVPLVRVREPLPAELRPAALTPASSVAISADAATPCPGLVNGLPQVAANDAVGLLLRDTLADIERAGRDVLALWQRHRAGQVPGHAGAAAAGVPAVPPAGARIAAPAPLPLPHRETRLLDVDSSIPWVRDHELYPQRPGWPVVADRHPVVPMTMEVLLVRDAAAALLQAHRPGWKVTGVERIQAYNWLAVAEPVTVEISLDRHDDHSLDAEIVGYFRARVTFAPDWPAAPASLPALAQPRATEVAAAELYSQRWMFHGPAYQGVAAFTGIGDNGIDGELRVPEGQGALLDNMGQLAGYWVMEQPQDCLAMPIGVDAIRFHGPDPLPGEMTRGQVRIRELDALNCVSDHRLADAAGRVLISIEGWRTRRYQMDKPFWVASRLLSRHEASQWVPPNVTLFEDRYDTAILRDYISRRYLTADERRTYDGLSPRRRRQWLAGRVAAKDAVTGWLRRERGVAEVWPQELCIVNDGSGRPQVLPHVTTTVPAALQVSITHKDNLALAIIGEGAVGIDLERVAPREESFLALTFTAAERELLLAGGEAPDIAWTRGWVVKEVAAKAAGTGLGGRLRDFVIGARDGDCFRVGDHWVVTHPLRDYIAGWSLRPSPQTDAGIAQNTPGDGPAATVQPQQRHT